MTAKEALHEAIEGLSEEECASWLERLRSNRRPVPGLSSYQEALNRPSLIGARRQSSGEASPADGLLSETQWQRFADAIDEGRAGYRTLFR